MRTNCIVCRCAALETAADYARCSTCGHEVLLSDAGQTFIVNDPLHARDATRTGALDRFKNTLLRKWMRGNGKLVDFGSSSGKFLAQNRALFRESIGVEVTEKAAVFSRGLFRLDIRESVDALPGELDVATFWHSLEHIPPGDLENIVLSISRRLRADGRIIVSVPNADSLQYRCLGRRYAYYDVPNHHHQFSLRSLDTLMQCCGLSRMDLAHSTVYNAFGWLQGSLNLMGGRHNRMYYRLKRKTPDDEPLRLAADFALLPIIAAPAALLTLVERTTMGRQGVITACYAR